MTTEVDSPLLLRFMEKPIYVPRIEDEYDLSLDMNILEHEGKRTPVVNIRSRLMDTQTFTATPETTDKD